LRKDKNLTQKNIAEKLNVTVATVSHWECGYQEPSLKDFSLLCDFFEVLADVLLGRKEYSC
jgi:transcriptional regulator with XRE-family HTH domain